MSSLASTQIPRPSDEQAFERASVVLWKGLLNDPTVQRNGRRGQRQNGVDLFGVRDGQLDFHVGIQCKLKSEDHTLTESEIREEVKKALTFKPKLKEYFIVTTAPDDVAIQEAARTITQELAAAGTNLRVLVWGWNTLEEKISEDAASRKAFDPSFTPHSEDILENTEKILAEQEQGSTNISSQLSEIKMMLSKSHAVSPLSDDTIRKDEFDKHIDAEIDGYRELYTTGKTQIALSLFEQLLNRVLSTASGRILFRIKANIAHCLQAQGKDTDAIGLLNEAYEHAPNEPMAVANKGLALLLDGDWKGLLDFGEEQLKSDPSNEWLAGYVIQGARFDMSISNPLQLVPENLHKAIWVQIGHIEFLRLRGEQDAWHQISREFLAAHPEEAYAVQYAAEATLDEILSSKEFQHTRILSAEERDALSKAMAALKSLWENKLQQDCPLRPEDAALCGNLVFGLRALNNHQAALEVAQQGLASLPDDAELMTRAAVVAMEADDEEFVGELLPKLPNTTDSFVLKFYYHAPRNNWDELVELIENEPSSIPDVEREVIVTTGKLASIKTQPGAPEELRGKIATVASEVSTDPRASIVVASFAIKEGFEDIANDAFEAAVRQINCDSPFADRMMVAHYASQNDFPSIVADLLIGYVSEDHDSSELRILAGALYTDVPVQQRAVSFFKRLPEHVRQIPYFLAAEGRLHFNRGALALAEISFRKACEKKPDLNNYLPLLSVLDRREKSNEANQIVRELDLEKLEGSPEQKLQLAQIIRRAGECERALDYGYTILQSARNSPQVTLLYFGLIMMLPDQGCIPSTKTVAIDTWVRLHDENQEVYAFLIEKGPNRPAEDILSPNHPTVIASLGLSIGDKFELSTGLRGPRTWQIKEIKHKYLYALHEVMENFEKRFPDANGFYSIKMKDGDVQPALDEIKRVSESNQKMAELYLERGVPSSFLASKRNGDTIGITEYVRSLGHNLITCVGLDAERNLARRTIRKYQNSGAVLDTYTAWTVATIDAFDIVKSVFGKIFVPQSLIDEVKLLKEEHQVIADKSMTIAWQDGRYVKQEYSAEDLSARRDYIGAQLTKIEANCEVCSVTIPDNPTELAILVYQSFGSHVLDAANLAGTEHLLISEDMNFRRFSDAACSASSTWLQPLFSYAIEQCTIDHSRYTELIVKLALRRHGHLSVDAATMFEAVRKDRASNLGDFEALSQFIGTRNADIVSHINVSLAFLELLWRKLGPRNLTTLKATGILLEKIIRYRSNDWAATLAIMSRESSNLIAEYIQDWVLGHFLDASGFKKAKEDFKHLRRNPRRTLDRYSLLNSTILSARWPS